MTLPACGTALVTGAGSGIGRACAAALAREGWQLLLVGRQEAPLRHLADTLGSGAKVIVADLAEISDLAAVAEACPGSLDVLVHSAGSFHHGPVLTTSAAQWASLRAVNLEAPLQLTATCLPALRAAGGQVVFINSTAGLQASTGNGAYAASKQALRVATDVLRQELRGSGVRCLSIFPGRTDTPMQQRVLAAEQRSGADIAMLAPEDIAEAAMAALRMSRRAEITDITVRPRNA